MPRLAAIALLAFTSAALALGCGSSSKSAADLPSQLPQIVVQAADLPPVVKDATWKVAAEGTVTSGSYADASAGLPTKAIAASGEQPIAAYERTLAGNGTQDFRELPYPPVVYNTVLVFRTANDAKAFFEDARIAAHDIDWLTASPGLEGATAGTPQLVDNPTALSASVDQILWLHSSGVAGDQGTVVDDVLIVRDGKLFAMIRAQGYFKGTTSREASTSVFESGLIIPVVRRLHDAAH